MQIHVRAPFVGGHDVISSITPCDGVCAGATPVGHPNFDGPKFAGYRTHKGVVAHRERAAGRKFGVAGSSPACEAHICGVTCPSDHPRSSLRENTRIKSGRCGFDSHRGVPF